MLLIYDDQLKSLEKVNQGVYKQLSIQADNVVSIIL